MAACLVILTASSSSVVADAPRLLDAVKRGDTAAARRLLQQGTSGHAADPDGTTALHWAIRADNVDLARALLQAGARASSANRYGMTPLSLAAVNGRAPAIELLLDAGADPNAAYGEGETALMTAARAGDPDAVRLLLSRGADPDARERSFGETALMWAAGHDRADAVRVLVSSGVDREARSDVIELPPTKVDFATMVTTALPKGGMTAVMYAGREGALSAAIALAEAGANLDAADPDGTTAVLFAIINAHFEVAAALVERGADPNAADGAGMAALYAAVDMQNPDALINRPRARPTGRLSASDLVAVLLKHGADPNQPLKAPTLMRQHNTGDASLGNGATPLMRAAKAGDAGLVRMLLDGGADPSRAMVNGTTAPMIVLSARGTPRTITPESPAFQSISLMLEKGLRLNATNAAGETLLHQSVTRGEAFVRLLLDHSADVLARDKSGRTALDVASGVAPAAPAAGGRGARGGGGRFGGPAGPPQRADEATIQLLRERMVK
jgi:ankyrin repeat protein